jgi:hypothetical protein
MSKKITFMLIMVFLLVAAASWGEDRVTVPIGDSPQKGPKDAPVTIIEFIDFQ